MVGIIRANEKNIINTKEITQQAIFIAGGRVIIFILCSRTANEHNATDTTIILNDNADAGDGLFSTLHTSLFL